MIGRDPSPAKFELGIAHTCSTFVFFNMAHHVACLSYKLSLIFVMFYYR